VACVGDSITVGWKLKEAERYVTKLAGLLGSDYDVQNFGHSAYTMLKIADKSYWDSPRFQAAQEFLPNIVTIMLGTNDAHPDYWPEYEDQYSLDYLDMIAAFQALPSNPRVIVLGLPYLKPGGRYDSGLSPNELMKDPIHPSAAAHTIMAETIYPVILTGGPVCGGGTCDPGEDSCNCWQDCGVPPSVESNCTNAIDEDCDGQEDCDDADCTGDPACQSLCDNDGVCEAGENCGNCSNDCDSLSRGRPNGRYCCGNGTLEGPEGDGRCDGNF
jgi:lysophospholipase L1-like esterase